jgi:hypothetical protein
VETVLRRRMRGVKRIERTKRIKIENERGLKQVYQTE